LRMKSYFANSVQAAIEDARRELGGDAILVTSRLTPAEAGKTRRYEVVFASDTPERKDFAEIGKTARANASPAVSSIEAVLQEIREIRQQLESLQRTSLAAPNGRAGQEDAATRQLLAHFAGADMDPDLAQELLAAAKKRMTPSQPTGAAETGGRFFEVLQAASSKLKPVITDLRAAVAAEIRDVFRVDSGFGGQPGKAAIAALIGPPGAGKTATIAKLAVRYGLQLRRPALLVSTDGSRVAAPEQLRGYASVLGIRFELAQSGRALGQLLEEHRANGLVLIDTAGFSAHELNESNEVMRFLAGRTDIQKHLVLPAPARGADTSRLSAAYELFRPSHLIFSRMDEATAVGPVLSAAMGSGRPVSFFATGQRVPEDVEEATASALIRRLLPFSPAEHEIQAAA
jgi:flagellar biosynthesis protein FlhF